MKKSTVLLSLFLILILTFILTGCSFLFPDNKPDDKGNDGVNNNDDIYSITSFDFIAEGKMQYVEDDEYFRLTLKGGENYQIKTTIDNSMGKDYHFKYLTEDNGEGQFTISEKGFIQTESDLNKSSSHTVYVELYKNDSTKRICRKYFILSLTMGDYANVTLTNDNLEFDASTKTYSMTINSGNSYLISHTVSYNVPYTLSYSLKDENHSSFLSVDANGRISTKGTFEDKVGEIIIKTIGENGVLDQVYLKVTVTKSEIPTAELKVYDKTTTGEIKNGDTLSLYSGNQLSFNVKYNGEEKTNAIEVGDSTVLELDNSTNTVKALKVGTSEVVFKYESEQVVITVEVIEDKIISLFAKNQGDDFLIINDTLRFLNETYLGYESGKEDVLDNSLITTSISNKDETFKTVSFEYGETKVSYDVKYYTVEDYQGQTTAYDNKDFFNQSIHGNATPLSANGKVKILAVPVWFSDSNKFFAESQKSQILEDVEYTLKGVRPNTELASLKQYYEKQSYGAIEMDITISDFYISDTSYMDYTDNSSSSKTYNDNLLATKVISWYFENNPEENFQDYDLNNDGYLDGMILLYAANYYGVESDGNNSYAFENTNYNNSDYAYNTFCFCPIGGLYGLAKKEPTTQLTVSDLSETYAKNFRSSARIIIHEVGHMFGNVDLYENSRANEDKYSPAGGFVMQDNNYGGHDPYQVNRIGWSKPQIYSSSDYAFGDKITIHLSDFQSSGQNIILTNTWNQANSLYDEYLIIELFAPTGLNEFDSKVTYFNIPQTGIRLWHVNSLLTDYSDNGNYTSKLTSGHLYDIASSNYDVENKYDLVHLIRNNPEEGYDTTSGILDKNVLFAEGDSFDMETYKSQFINGDKLDNGDKLGWKFVVEEIYLTKEGSYGAVITLERVDNVKTDFSKTVTLNRDDLETPDGEEDYSEEIFGANGEFTFTYKYTTPPSVYIQEYPISSDGMCLFASADGNGGFIEIAIKEIEGKQVRIDSITVTYSYLTNATPTVFANGEKVEGKKQEAPAEAYTFNYAVNSTSVKIQNQYSETIDHWSPIALWEITINYVII